MLDVLYYIASRSLIQLSHLLLGKPYGLIRKLHIDVRVAILSLIYDYLVVIHNN